MQTTLTCTGGISICQASEFEFLALFEKSDHKAIWLETGYMLFESMEKVITSHDCKATYTSSPPSDFSTTIRLRQSLLRAKVTQARQLISSYPRSEQDEPKKQSSTSDHTSLL